MSSSTVLPPYRLILQIDKTSNLTGTEWHARHAALTYCLRSVIDDRLAARLAPIAKRWVGEQREAYDGETYKVVDVGAEQGTGHIYLICLSEAAEDMRCWSPNEFERFSTL
jgi:hypothetical protein